MDSLFKTGEDDCFYFESDHLALRGNKDYCEILKTLVILTAQREKLLKDYTKVVELKNDVLQDTGHILKKIQNGEDLGIQLPGMIEIPKIPVVNFENYNVKVPESEVNLIYSQNTANSNAKKLEEELKKERDKAKYDCWSTEEQKKLEELLLKYPPEPIERRRYQKIANELGTRSVAQVASRIQKYFLKLFKAGLPVPGKIGKNWRYRNKAFTHKHQRYNRFLWKQTTFFPQFHPPVVMDELDSIPGPSSSLNLNPSSDTQPSNNYLMEADDQERHEITGKTDKELQIQLLKRVKEEKLREQESGNPFQHIGYKCDHCESEPIIGSRWNCIICSGSIDYCTDCVVSQMFSNNSHPLTHPMAVFQDNDNWSLSHGDDLSYEENMKKDNGESGSDDTNDSYAFEYINVKEEHEEGFGTDEESRSNFDSDMN